MVSFLIALALGALSAFAFEPFGLGPLMILGFAALCELTARAPNLKRALLLGWGFGVGQFCVGLNWIATAFTYQAAMPAWLGWVAVFLLSLYLAVYPMLATGLAWRFGQTRRIALLLALAGGWAISEWLRATMFTGFAWNPVGVVLVDTPLMGASGAVGTYGLSALTVLLGGALWLAWRREVWPVAAIGAGLLLVWAFPTAPVPETNPARKPIRIVQPNIGQEDKWREGLAEESFARLESLSAGGIAAPRLLFWPEVAVVEPFQILGPDQRPLPVPLPAVPRAAQSARPGDLLVTGAFALIADDLGTVTG
ncbi:MAG: apolipoprotein N-acyltransferase, partial [Pseudomonadota bacterium]|nr:apolipoprotein N-acyltransferase [Pseudomonadota bacterium]